MPLYARRVSAVWDAPKQLLRTMSGILTIFSNLAAVSTERRLGQNTKALEESYTRLASGLRINRAKDDAAGLAISESLKVDARVYDQGTRNINDTVSLTNIEEGALRELATITMRQMELAEQAANGVYSGSQRQAMDQEARELTAEYNRIVLSTEYNGIPLFTSPYDELRTQFGAGTENSINSTLADQLMTKVTPGSYFTISGADKNYYVWFTIDGAGSNPGIAGYTGVRIDLVSPTGGGPGPYLFSAADIADEVATALSATGSFTSSVESGTVVRLVAAPQGQTLDVDEGNCGIVCINTVTLGDDYSAYSMAGTVSSYYLEDLNSDGKGDLVTLTPGSSSINVRLNNGDGTFAGPTNYGTEANPQTLYLSDMNNDGKLDLAAMGLSFIDVRLNTGNGTFGSMISTSTGGGGTILRDINNDGVLDYVNTMLGTLRYAYGTGTGSFSSATSCTFFGTILDSSFADINGDGKMDIVSSYSAFFKTNVLLSNANGTFSPYTSYSVSNDPLRFFIEDINGDGKKDIIAECAGAHHVLINNGNGSFKAAMSFRAPPSPEFYFLEDISGDGIKDLITAGATTCRLGNGDGAFGTEIQYLSASNAGSALLQDLNGDGFKDMMVTDTSTNKAYILLNNGNGTFKASTSYSMGSTITKGYLSDLNGDGFSDLITLDGTGSTLSTRFNDGTGKFGARCYFQTGASPSSAYTEDIDGDGDQDVVVLGSSGTKLSVHLNDGNGVLGTYQGSLISFSDPRGMCLVNGIDLSTQEGACEAMSRLDQRLTRIDQQLGAVGALQSRLDVALHTVSVARDSYLAARSQIVDADMAEESAQLVRSQILQQASLDVLKQADRLPELALKLLKE